MLAATHNHDQQDHWGLIRCFMTRHYGLVRYPATLTGLQIVDSIRNGRQLLIRARLANADIAAIQ
jgi:hypothetical protein